MEILLIPIIFLAAPYIAIIIFDRHVSKHLKNKNDIHFVEATIDDVNIKVKKQSGGTKTIKVGTFIFDYDGGQKRVITSKLSCSMIKGAQLSVLYNSSTGLIHNNWWINRNANRITKTLLISYWPLVAVTSIAIYAYAQN